MRAKLIALEESVCKTGDEVEVGRFDVAQAEFLGSSQSCRIIVPDALTQ